MNKFRLCIWISAYSFAAIASCGGAMAAGVEVIKVVGANAANDDDRLIDYCESVRRKILPTFPFIMDCSPGVFQFRIAKDGTVSHVALEIYRGCKDGSDKGLKAIRDAGPFEKLPIECDSVTFRIESREIGQRIRHRVPAENTEKK